MIISFPLLMYFRSYLCAPPYSFHLPVHAIVVRRSEWRNGSLTCLSRWEYATSEQADKNKKTRAQVGGVTTDSTAWKKTKASQPLTLLFSMPLKDLIVWYQSRWRKKFVRVAKGIYPRRNTSCLVGRRVTNEEATQLYERKTSEREEGWDLEHW